MELPHASQPSPEQPAASPGPAQPPRHFNFVLGLAAALGGLGLFVGLVSMALMASQSPEAMLKQARAVTKAMVSKAPMPAAMGENLEKAQDELVSDVLALSTQMRPFTWGLGLSNLVLSTGLLAGAFLVRARREKGRRLLGAVAWGHLPFQGFGIAIKVATAMGMARASGKLISRMMGGVHEGATAAQVASAMGAASQWLGAAFGVGWGLALAGFYLWLALFLRRPDVRRLCS
jgi:hypothetical protein